MSVLPNYNGYGRHKPHREKLRNKSPSVSSYDYLFTRSPSGQSEKAVRSQSRTQDRYTDKKGKGDVSAHDETDVRPTLDLVKLNSEPRDALIKRPSSPKIRMIHTDDIFPNGDRYSGLILRGLGLTERRVKHGQGRYAFFSASAPPVGATRRERDEEDELVSYYSGDWSYDRFHGYGLFVDESADRGRCCSSVLQERLYGEFMMDFAPCRHSDPFEEVVDRFALAETGRPPESRPAGVDLSPFIAGRCLVTRSVFTGFWYQGKRLQGCHKFTLQRILDEHTAATGIFAARDNKGESCVEVYYVGGFDCVPARRSAGATTKSVATEWPIPGALNPIETEGAGIKKSGTALVIVKCSDHAKVQSLPRDDSVTDDAETSVNKKEEATSENENSSAEELKTIEMSKVKKDAAGDSYTATYHAYFINDVCVWRQLLNREDVREMPGFRYEEVARRQRRKRVTASTSPRKMSAKKSAKSIESDARDGKCDSFPDGSCSSASDGEEDVVLINADDPEYFPGYKLRKALIECRGRRVQKALQKEIGRSVDLIEDKQCTELTARLLKERMWLEKHGLVAAPEKSKK